MTQFRALLIAGGGISPETAERRVRTTLADCGEVNAIRFMHDFVERQGPDIREWKKATHERRARGGGEELQAGPESRLRLTMHTVRRPSRSRPHIGSVPSLPIGILHLRGWKWSECCGDAMRGGVLSYCRSGMLTGRVTYSATVGRESGTLWLECSFADEPVGTTEVITLTSVPNPWGGGRHWFFVCPASGRRARKLHRWAGLGFSHRHAAPIPPVYASQRDGGMARTARAMQDIRKLLGGLPWEVEKPSGMSWKRFYRLCMRYATLHDSFWAPTRTLLARLD